MEKITVKNLIDFRAKSDRARKTFVTKLRNLESKSSDSGTGGEYWAISLSAIGNSYKYYSTSYIDNKIEELREKNKCHRTQ